MHIECTVKSSHMTHFRTNIVQWRQQSKTAHMSQALKHISKTVEAKSTIPILFRHRASIFDNAHAVSDHPEAPPKCNMCQSGGVVEMEVNMHPQPTRGQSKACTVLLLWEPFMFVKCSMYISTHNDQNFAASVKRCDSRRLVHHSWTARQY